MQVDNSALWGAQTQRSLRNFAIGSQQFPALLIRALVLVKKAAATSNNKLGKLDQNISQLITQACDEVLCGDHTDQFPLSVWQTGSGTQTNMNVNEVIANRANELAGGKRGDKQPVHPNDHVNLSQSSNDVFPTAMHIACYLALQEQLLPALQSLTDSIKTKQQAFADIIKTGRTHMMDATPLTLGQEFSAYQSQLRYSQQVINDSVNEIQELAIGGTAVGTGLNSPANWRETITAELSELTQADFKPCDNTFMALSAHDPLLQLSGKLKVLGTALFKIANDIRLLGSGPRCGFGELQLPANEPGSSIMPGKVNPTQAEALTMIALQVIGNDTAITMAGSQGHLELNVFKPLIIHNLLESIELLSDGCDSFAKHCVDGLQAREENIQQHLDNSLMLVTALTPITGYDNAATAAKLAFEKGLTLKQAVLNLELMTAEEFDQAIRPENMLGPSAPES